MDQAPPKKMAPGDDMHLTLLMAPHNLNLVTGQDRQHLLAFGRAAFEAGQYATKDNMLLAVIAENERLNAQLTTASQLLQQMLAEFGRDGHGGEFEDGEHPLIDEVRAFLTGTPYAVRTKQSRAWRIYIAGPMTGLPDLNFPAFNAAADELRNQGWHVENPAAHGVIDGAQWEDYLAYDITRLGTCGAIYLLPGWEKSKGATLEAHIAKMLGLQVLLAPGAEDVQPLQKTVPQKFTGDSEMRRAFEIEYGQTWTDPDWRRETGIWASAWHKATAAAQQGVRNRVLVDAGALQMVVNALRRDAFEGKPSRGEMADELLSSATHPTQQGLEQFIEQAGDVHFQRCRLGSIKGPIRWDVSFGHHGIEVRGKTLQEAIAKALAAQAKQGGEVNV
ncbi:DUF4406 domain-containing protein [Comamonas kerstersii]|uniref:DUF4406 domain-containing protein n=1 Tax=Comamonas kerstersii TaxID=225992 RepID=UPI0009D1936B|nr:DUF4406 domain-containing protein [Comamonas kerstersii]OOH86280.1 hypothetical protein BMF38_09110 [Comamonas kerstersii]OOH92289.1 hypothetical protein BMF29_08360 [Comamonas kerstersii]